MNWNKEDINKVWEKGTIVEGYDADKYRKDACGAWMMRDKHGAEHNFGWEIDHIYPISRGGDNKIDNLRPMHYLNNRSKANDYPRYKVAITSNGTRNEEADKYIIVNEQTQRLLFALYSAKK